MAGRSGGRSLLLRRSPRAADEAAGGAPPFTAGSGPPETGDRVDLSRRRDQLSAKVAELQFDLGGLVYEMAIRNQMRVDLLVKRAAAMQNVDAELNEVERILRLEQTSTAGACPSCGAPHSSGAGFCWQCGQPILEQVSSDAIAAPVIVPSPAAVTPPPASIVASARAAAAHDAPTRTAL